MTDPPEVGDLLGHQDISVIDGRDTVERFAKKAEGRQKIIRIISLLRRKATRKQAQAVELHLERGLTQAETAQALGISERAVRYRLNCWLKNLGANLPKLPIGRRRG